MPRPKAFGRKDPERVRRIIEKQIGANVPDEMRHLRIEPDEAKPRPAKRTNGKKKSGRGKAA